MSGASAGQLKVSTPYVYIHNDHPSGSKEYWASRATVRLEFYTPNLNISTSVKDNKGGTVTGAGDYDYNVSVTIQANPNAGYTFSGWSGTASGTTNPLTYSAS